MPSSSSSPNPDQSLLQQMDPDLYNRVKPHIQEIVRELGKQEVPDSVLDAVVDELILSMQQSMDSPEGGDLAVAAIGGIFPQRQPLWPAPYRAPGRRRWRYTGGFSTDDMIRYLLLQRLGYL